jgi:anti-sigma factor RsiW
MREDAAMTCHDVRQQRYACLDGTLAESHRAAVQRHLEACISCRSELAGIGQLEDRLRAAFHTEPVPPSLWPRIRADLVPRTTTTVPRGRVLPWPWWAAAVLLLALSIALLRGLILPAGAREARLLSVPVQDLHTFLVSQRSLDVTSPDPQHLHQWFQGKVDFSPPLVPRQAGTATLAGGRLCYFLDRRVASFMYTVDSHYVSLYVMPRHGLPSLPRDSVRRAGHETRTYALQGYTQIIWSHRDLLYALVSDLPSATLRALAQGLAEAG